MGSLERHLLLLALLPAGCARTPSFVGLPELGGMQSAIVAQSTSFETTLIAIDPSQDFSAIEWTLSDSTVEVLGYRRSLSALGLEVGPIPVVSDTPSRGLPTQDALFRLENNHGQPGDWTVSQERSSGLAAAKIRGAPPVCASFDLQPLNITASNANRWGIYALRTDGRAALSVYPDGASYLVSPDGSIEEHHTLDFSASATDEEGRLWAITAEGDLFVGNASVAPDVLRFVSRGVLGAIPTALAAGRDPGGSDEAYVMTNGFGFYRYARGGWELLFNFPEREATLAEGDVERLGPGEALAVGPFSDAVVHYSEGMVSSETTPSSQGLTLVKWVPSVGLVLGAGTGEFFLRRGPNMYEPIPGSPTHAWSLALAPFGDGFVVGGPFGAFMQYTKAGGFCEPIAPVPATITGILPFGGSLIVVGDPHQAGASPSAAVMRPR